MTSQRVYSIDFPVAHQGTMLPLATDAQRVLLLHPPIYDLRVPWGRYIQPIRLLRLSTLLRERHCDVRLIDAVPATGKPFPRTLAKHIIIENRKVSQWRFGAAPAELARQMRALAQAPWEPDVIYVECLTTFWWEGAAEIIRLAHAQFPHARICLFGAYADLAPDHARGHIEAHDIGTLDWTQLTALRPDLSFGNVKPPCVYVSLGHGTRSAAEVVSEIQWLNTDHRVQNIAFLDHAITTTNITAFQNVLETICATGLKANLYALGTIPLHDVVTHPDLLALMRRAGYVHLCFADDRDSALSDLPDQAVIEHARQAGEYCRAAGFHMRSEEVVASLCLGRPGESIDERSQLAVHLTHSLGSLIFWPYQPMPEELPEVPLEQQNGKLFPCRGRNHLTFDEYMRVLGLASVLNAKYRSETFDFLGPGLVAQLFRESMQRQAWDPPEEVKGTLQLPARRR